MTGLSLLLRKTTVVFLGRMLPKVIVLVKGCRYRLCFQDTLSVEWKLTVTRGNGSACYVQLNDGDRQALKPGCSKDFIFQVEVSYGNLKKGDQGSQ